MQVPTPRNSPDLEPLPAKCRERRATVACNYCRKRKMRCSGSGIAQDRPCENCAQHNKECVFTRVRPHTRARKPGHAVNPHVYEGHRGVPRVPGRPGEGRMQEEACVRPPTLQHAHQPPHKAMHTLPQPHGMYQPPYDSSRFPLPHQTQDQQDSAPGYPYSNRTVLPLVSVPITGPGYGPGHLFAAGGSAPPPPGTTASGPCEILNSVI